MNKQIEIKLRKIIQEEFKKHLTEKKKGVVIYNKKTKEYYAGYNMGIKDVA